MPGTLLAVDCNPLGSVVCIVQIRRPDDAFDRGVERFDIFVGNGTVAAPYVVFQEFVLAVVLEAVAVQVVNGHRAVFRRC
jgi:hypothetical protein